MASLNGASLCNEFDGYEADIASLRKEGRITIEFDVVLTGLCCLMAILIAVFLERRTKKTSKHLIIAVRQG